jgi:hypothetical protein
MCVCVCVRERPPLFVAHNVSVRACVRACMRVPGCPRVISSHLLNLSLRVCLCAPFVSVCRHGNG